MTEWYERSLIVVELLAIGVDLIDLGSWRSDCELGIVNLEIELELRFEGHKNTNEYSKQVV